MGGEWEVNMESEARVEALVALERKVLGVRLGKVAMTGSVELFSPLQLCIQCTVVLERTAAEGYPPIARMLHKRSGNGTRLLHGS